MIPVFVEIQRRVNGIREVGNRDFQNVCVEAGQCPSMPGKLMDELISTPDPIEHLAQILPERQATSGTIAPLTPGSRRELLLASVRNPRGWAGPALAFLVFVICSALLYGPGIAGNPSTIYVGGGHDPAGYIWSIVWWPYAIAHGLNPFIARVIWSPVGFNLAWAAAIPGPSLLLWPITRLLGPVVAFNLLMILTPPIVAWSAFLLCRRISGEFWVSLVSGCLFGFCPYMIGHMLMGQPNLTLIFGVPLCSYLVLLKLDDSIRRSTFVALFAAVFTLQFLVSTEIAALITLFGGIALTIAFAVLPLDQRSALRRSLPSLAPRMLSPEFYYFRTFTLHSLMVCPSRCIRLRNARRTYWATLSHRR